MEISRYPDLSLVKEEPPSPCLSPVLPMLPAPDGKGKHTQLQHQLTFNIIIFIPVILIKNYRLFHYICLYIQLQDT